MTSMHDATKLLARRDKTMRSLVKRFGQPRWPAKPKVANRFERLARSICGQQLAGKAAATIWERTVALLEEDVTPAGFLQHDIKSLRTAGLSRNKALSMLDLAARVEDGQIDLAAISRKSDEDVIKNLVQVRGIGEWTAQMFLMFGLRRLDVWATGDFGVRKGYMLAYGLDDMPTQKELLPMGDVFQPVRSLACWYCWRVADAGG